jgi:hypothetical protein
LLAVEGAKRWLIRNKKSWKDLETGKKSKHHMKGIFFATFGALHQLLVQEIHEFCRYGFELQVRVSISCNHHNHKTKSPKTCPRYADWKIHNIKN